MYGGTGFGSRGPLPTCAGMGRESFGLECSSTIPVCPRDRANLMAVSPIRFGYWGRHRLVSNSNFTTSCQLPAAHESGVRLYKASVALGSMSVYPSSNFTASSSPFSEAQESGVRSEKVSVVLGLIISARLKNNFATLSWPPLGARPNSVSAL